MKVMEGAFQLFYAGFRPHTGSHLVSMALYGAKVVYPRIVRLCKVKIASMHSAPKKFKSQTPLQLCL